MNNITITTPATRPRFPAWLRKPVAAGGRKGAVERCLREGNLHTVCAEAHCPNRGECFSRGAATFLMLGDICTRNCAFCSVRHGAPLPVDEQEPQRLLAAVRQMGLSYVVITMVTRDDLGDGGAGQIARTVMLLKRTIPGIRAEVLTSDFQGNESSLATVLASAPDVFNHNIETVPSISSRIRPQADYDTSLAVLRFAATRGAGCIVKSGFMVGLGETEREVLALMHDLRACGVSVLTIGQYLQPAINNTPVVEFIPPERFDRYRNAARQLGFADVRAGPFVRSSYRAEETLTR